MTRCHEDESCSKVLNFLGRLDDRIVCVHEKTDREIKPREDTWGNKSLGCIFSEKSADWTNTFELEISGLTDLYDVFLHGQFWAKNESKVPNRIRERDVVTTGSNGVREGNGAGLRWRKEGEKKSFCFVVVEFELIFCHQCFDVIYACKSTNKSTASWKHLPMFQLGPVQRTCGIIWCTISCASFNTTDECYYDRML